MAPVRTLLPALCAALLLVPLSAQWNPTQGDWDKDGPGQLRVMTWNVQDAICRTNDKQSGASDPNWEACARIVASLRPDVLVLQEAGDNTGNGTGGSSDSVSQLETTIDLFLRGGNDPFLGGAVQEYVQKYAPGFDMPHVFVSSDGDGFNRNVILSVHPFTDLNGDGISTLSDMWTISAGGYVQVGGNVEPRGTPWAEIDLPDAIFSDDLVIANSHLKSGGSQTDKDTRIVSGQRLAFFIYHYWNGAGTGGPDPFNRVFDTPAAQSIVTPGTLIVHAGDFNDFNYPSEDGLVWSKEADVSDAQGSTDGPEDDGSDLALAAALDVFNGSPATQGGSALDRVLYEDGDAVVARAFVFNTSTIPGGGMPAELLGFSIPAIASSVASDHRAVVVDFVPANGPDSDGDGVVDALDNCPLPNPDQADLNSNGVGDVCEATLCAPTLDSGGTMFLSACGDVFAIDISMLFAPHSAPGFLIVGASLLPVPLPLTPGTGVLLPALNFILPFTTASSGLSTTVGTIGGGLGPGSNQIFAQCVVIDPSSFQFLGTNALEIQVFKP
ncbi:MAG: endonuclease/exonuclease/phosphatase family protein [Planctomycetota bacterium]|nr:endonuclease/exonuclease/phosphatase family protein [Planctomycetota bacterium]